MSRLMDEGARRVMNIEWAAYFIRQAWTDGRLPRDAEPDDAPPDIALAWKIARWRDERPIRVTREDEMVVNLLKETFDASIEDRGRARLFAPDYVDLILAGVIDPVVGAAPYIDNEEQAAFHEAVRYVMDNHGWRV